MKFTIGSIKNISYGALCLTNSKETYDFFDQEIAYTDNPKDEEFIRACIREEIMNELCEWITFDADLEP